MKIHVGMWLKNDRAGIILIIEIENMAKPLKLMNDTVFSDEAEAIPC